MSRTVVVDGLTYTIDVMVSTPLHRDRLGSGWYIHVELPGVWKAVFGAPPGVHDVSTLMPAQMDDYVREAQRLVALRRPDNP